MILDSNNHSVLLLYYHLILVVKYRRKVFDDYMSDFAKNIFVRISQAYNITLEQWKHDKYHVHIMFRTHPNTEISKFINTYKSASSRLIKKKYPAVRKKLMEGNVLVKEFLFTYHRRSSYRSHKTIYRKTGYKP